MARTSFAPPSSAALVLVIDDDLAVCALVLLALEAEGLPVHAAADGSHARQRPWACCQNGRAGAAPSAGRREVPCQPM